jgi:outer membrane immunogenic protein
MRRMSLFVLCAAAVFAEGAALAGPFDESVLRGSALAYGDGSAVQPRYVPGTPAYYRWEGLYLGGQAGYTGASVDFGNGTASLIDYILRNDVVGTHVAGWTTLNKVETAKPMFGAFVGYNFQVSELIYGVELNYNRVHDGGLHGSSSDSMTRTFTDDTAAPAQHHYFYTATVTSSASALLKDFGTIRGRAGVAFDRFLPYAFAAFAVGRVDTNRSATVSYQRQDIPDVVDPPITPQPTFFFGPQTRAEIRENVIAYGYAAGLGIDVAFTPNVFMRAEWEYLQFFPVQDVKIHLNTFRAGLGLKF